MIKRHDEKRVTVIGLGNMGGALAHSLLKGGCQVTVWNRTVAKASSLVEAGATLAPSLTDALSASPLSIVCATDMSASKLIYQKSELKSAMVGKTLADLSTGTADDAVKASSWVSEAGGSYLDGGILCYPRDIGTADASILYAGDLAAFKEHEATLAVMAGAQRHLGEAPGAAATVYLALWAFYFGALTAYFEAGALAATADVPVDRFRELSATMMPKLTDGIADATDRLLHDKLDGDQAPVDIYIENLILVRNTFAGAGKSHLTVDAFLELLQQAKNRGDGDKDVATVFRRAIESDLSAKARM